MILQGDCRLVLPTLPAASVDCVVTSPPYWALRDYGSAAQLGQESTPTAYVEALADIFDDVKRVLAPRGTVWLNLGDCYAYAKGGAQGRTGQAANRTRAKAGVRVIPQSKLVEGLKAKDLCGIPWRAALALQQRGWYLRSSIIWAKTNPTPESVRDRPTQAYEYVFLLTPNAKYFYDADAVREESVTYGRAGTAPHRNARNVWTMASQPSKEAHFASMPPALVARCIQAGCPVGGMVLDPFLGTGTTGSVAAALGRRWTGIELNPAYVAIAARRTAVAHVNPPQPHKPTP